MSLMLSVSIYNRKMSSNEELHRLIDMLPEADLRLASRFLQFLTKARSRAASLSLLIPTC